MTSLCAPPPQNITQTNMPFVPSSGMSNQQHPNNPSRENSEVQFELLARQVTDLFVDLQTRMQTQQTNFQN